ncbi:MAG: hypothetical protein ABIG30_02625 [Candidatus Aenigmatarchaeota archaeon]
MVCREFTDDQHHQETKKIELTGRDAAAFATHDTFKVRETVKWQGMVYKHVDDTDDGTFVFGDRCYPGRFSLYVPSEQDHPGRRIRFKH